MARVDKLKAFCCPANIDGELSFSINDPIGIGFKYQDRSERDDINEYTKIERNILLYQAWAKGGNRKSKINKIHKEYRPYECEL